jgi:exodeoxyribonuclease V beta subunit
MGWTPVGRANSKAASITTTSGQTVIDFRPEVSDGERAEIKWRRRQEQDAEFMRLIYVALTRAVYRCYLVAGCYATQAFGNRSLTQSSRSLLNWLVAGSGISHGAWHGQRRTAEEIEVAWRALAEAAGPILSLSDLPAAVGVPFTAAIPPVESLRALTPPVRILSAGASAASAACNRAPTAKARPATTTAAAP